MSQKFLVPIVLPADPAAAMEAVTKQYVDARAGSEVEISATDPIGTNANAELWIDTATADIPYSQVPTTRVINTTAPWLQGGGALSGDLTLAVQVSAWTAVTFANGWVNYDAGHPAQYRKVGDIVEIRGLIKSGTMGQTAFTLPTGFRPVQTDETFCCLANAALGQVNVFSDGRVVVGAGSNVYTYLSGIRFSVTA